ncbi:MAG TPA: PadR family transcriptional regulator [Thermoplasmataceae archaeon]|nr:PadR family transcriptional regulator [Thermoplasmatales archaeon AK]HLH85982.1 PadR family transcriptional regulator [Thermoplasmataceae archaeon]
MPFPDPEDFRRGFSRNWYSGFNFAKNFRYHGGMRYYVLWLLNRSPMKGADIINEISRQTMGWWKPSPGTIYPLLSNLEKESLIRRLPDLRYELTDRGREEIGAKVKESDLDETWNLERIVSDFESYLSYLEEQTNDVSAYRERLRAVAERLRKIIGE